MDFERLSQLRRTHPAWRLLTAEHAPLVLAFVHREYVEPNRRSAAEPELAERLEDFLYHLRERLGPEAFPRPARDYLADWADDSRRWLRRYYPPDSDVAHLDITPACEQVLTWISGFEQRHFVGAESRLKLVFDILREIAHGTETDPDARVRELERRRDAIDAEIDRIRSGQLDVMDPTQLRERVLQCADTAQALLADFRQVEQNFRDLDRQIRERIAIWEGSKEEVLEEIFGERDLIAESDQGRSFRAFWDFLMSPARQEQLSALLANMLSLPPVAELEIDSRLSRIHHDWAAAGEVTLRTVARLSEQLRRYLDDQVWMENRRIMDLIRGIEQNALALRERPPAGAFMEIDESGPRVSLPMSRPLFSPPLRPLIALQPLDEGEPDFDIAPLFDQVFVDREALRAHLRRALAGGGPLTLAEVLERHPLEQGLSELVAWLGIASEDPGAAIDESAEQSVLWVDGEGRTRKAAVPLVVFSAAAHAIP